MPPPALPAPPAPTTTRCATAPSPSSRPWSGSRRSRDADPADEDAAPFDAFLAELRAQFPLLHERLELTPVTDHGLLFRWAGRDAARPVVLMAHLDVVPVDGDATWQHPPFGADIVDGEIWGRGTLDDKGSLVGICEAVERLLEQDFVPAQDVWLSFGCDEEVMGVAAPAAVAILRERGVTPVVRPRRGRRGRPRGVPRRRAADRGHRRHREGRHLARAAGRRPRRARLDPGPDGRRPPGWPARSCAWTSTRSRPAPRARRSS